MKTLLITPKNKKELNFFKEFFQKTNTPITYVSEKTETLEDKIIRLYQEKHYTEEDIEWFFSIPKKYRVDPFEMIDDGDIYYADQRNLDKLKKDLEQGREDLKNGKTISLKPTDNSEDFWKQIREYAI